MTIEEVVRKVVLDEHADVIREAVADPPADLLRVGDTVYGTEWMIADAPEDGQGVCDSARAAARARVRRAGALTSGTCRSGGSVT